MNLPLIIGHRGSCAVAPENTLAAFKQSIKDGADGIEFDVRLAKDGVPVVIHDDNLKRTARIRARVNSLTSCELSRIDVSRVLPNSAASNCGVPLLSQVMELFHQSPGVLYLEMKGEPVGSELPKVVAKIIKDFDLLDRVFVESFDHDAVAAIKKIEARTQPAPLFDRNFLRRASSQKIIQRCKELDAHDVALHHSLATNNIVRDICNAGFDVVVWTVDDPSWIARARAVGIKALITNDPARLLQARDAS